MRTRRVLQGINDAGLPEEAAALNHRNYTMQQVTVGGLWIKYSMVWIKYGMVWIKYGMVSNNPKVSLCFSQPFSSPLTFLLTALFI